MRGLYLRAGLDGGDGYARWKRLTASSDTRCCTPATLAPSCVTWISARHNVFKAPVNVRLFEEDEPRRTIDTAADLTALPHGWAAPE